MTRDRFGRLRERVTLGIAVVALFAAVGGPSYAAKTVEKIRGNQIANHAVTSSKVAPDAITTSKVKNRTLRLADLAPSTRAALVGTTGPAGPKGDVGAPATRMFARVAANGTLVAGSPGAAVTKVATGTYEVRWSSESLSACAAVMSMDDDLDGGLAVARRSPSASTANAVRVVTQLSMESQGHEPRDYAFAVAVFC